MAFTGAKPSLESYELEEFQFSQHKVKCYTEKEDEFGFPSKSTGTTVWPSALLLCKYLVANEDLVKNKVVVELGCGTALPGLLASQTASQVFLTDKSKRILASGVRSIAANSLPEGHLCSTQRLSFGNFAEGQALLDQLRPDSKIDLIIASDVLYAASAIEAFWATVVQLCDASARTATPDAASSAAAAPAAPPPPAGETPSQKTIYPTIIMSFVSRDEAQDEAMLYAARTHRFDYEQIPFDSFIPEPKDIPSSNFVRPETMRLFKFTRREPPSAAAGGGAMAELHAQLSQRRVAHLCT